MSQTTSYYLGLDMGTNSVGWAVTNKSYELMRVKGKDLWGVRLFPAAESAADRRTHRTDRRRRQREKARIELFTQYFEDEINKVDEGFLHRLQDSGFKSGDKREETKFSLFNDKLYTDKSYYKAFPTIFHLRTHLLNTKDKMDVRLLYLALLNMFKHRGHFLSSDLEFSDAASVQTLFDALSEQLEESIEVLIDFRTEREAIIDQLKDKNCSRTQKSERLANLCGFSKSKEKQKYEVVKALCGLSVKLDLLVGEEVVNEDKKKVTFSFIDKDYDERRDAFSQLIDESLLETIDLLKLIHDGILLETIKGEFRYLSEARVALYEKHQKDLQDLKSVVRKYASQEVYDNLFRNEVEASYSAYVNGFNSDVKKRRGFKNSTQSDLYGTLKKILNGMPTDDERVISIKAEIDNETFLPKQLTLSNGVIPNQIHADEMKALLMNAEKHYDFLLEKDDSGLTVSERLLKLFTFQIPYYIGPLNVYHKDKKGNAWAVRKEAGQVLPWNFDQKVDVQASAEAFIKNLVRKCTYMTNERVLPKSSLLYEKFMVLNELNKIKVRNVPMDVPLKQAIYTDLFLKGKKVTHKGLHQYLVKKGIIHADEVHAITGLDGDFKNTLRSHSLFKDLLQDTFPKDSVIQMVEKIIFWGTVYGDDKSFYKDKVKATFGNELTEAQLKRILGFKFKEWGNLSKPLLELNGVNKETGESLSLIQAMWENNVNLNELLSERFTYVETLALQAKTFEKKLQDITYDDLEGHYLSVAVKRMVWQTLLIVKELESVLGAPPERLFVEMAREHDEKGKRTQSRKDQLMSLYKSIASEKELYQQIKNEESDTLRRKKIYLYYLQKGRCMYTGEKITFSDLFNENLYDIDHIYPRHFVKDDSLHNNLVLVKKEKNAHKKDHYPLEKEIVSAQKAFWKSLLTPQMTDRFITREKYNRLVCRDAFTSEQLAGFINRQLVETRQGTKAITKIFTEALVDTEVIFVKAGLVSDFRHKFKLLKSRALNDFHHAQDAYLNIVVGNAYFVKFTKNPMNFINAREKNPSQNPYHMEKFFDYTVKRGNEVAWQTDQGANKGTIGLVKKIVSRNTPLITHMVYEGHGQLFNATVVSAEKAKEGVQVPLKKKAPYDKISEYGAYNSVSIAYFFLVEHDVKKKRIRSLEAMPIMDVAYAGKSEETLMAYCQNELKLNQPKILVKKILINSYFKKDGFYLNLKGKTLVQISVSNAVSLVLEREWVNYIKKIEKYILSNQVDEKITSEKNIELYQVLVDKHVHAIFKNRPNSMGEFLSDRVDKFLKLKIADQIFVLNQILLLTQLASYSADLRLIGGTQFKGKPQISKTISGSTEFKLIHQSPTGLYSKEIDLLKL